MSGVIGQKWGKDKVKNLKIGTYVKGDYVDKIIKIGKINKWGLSRTVREIIIDWFELAGDKIDKK